MIILLMSTVSLWFPGGHVAGPLPFLPCENNAYPGAFCSPSHQHFPFRDKAAAPAHFAPSDFIMLCNVGVNWINHNKTAEK
jgi:hypothetical protein